MELDKRVFKTSCLARHISVCLIRRSRHTHFSADVRPPCN